MMRSMMMMTMKMKVMMLRRVSRKQFHSSPKWSREDNEEKEGQLLKHEDKQTDWFYNC
jgi:hypothetical protein